MSYNPLPQPADVVVNTGVSTSPVSNANPLPVTGNVDISTTSTLPVSFANNFNIDLFGRLKVSNPYTFFDDTHRYDQNGNFSDVVLGVGSTVGIITAQSTATLGIGTTSGSSVIRETKRVFPYLPGKSLQVLQTFVLNPAKTNLVQRVGYASSENGIMIELNGSQLNIIKRTAISGVGTTVTVPQSEWNIDKLDGTGVSGVNLDITKSQILFTEYEWLGVGAVRVGFINADGNAHIAHIFNHANLLDSVYMTTAVLPVRYEIFNTGITTSSSTMKQICISVQSNGGYEKKVIETIARRTTNTTVGTSFKPLVSIRLAPGRENAVVIPNQYSTLPISSGNFEIAMIKNAILTGDSWTSTDSTNVQADYSATSLSGGKIIKVEYVASTNQSRFSINRETDYNWDTQLGRTQTKQSDTYTLAARILTGTGDIIGSLGFYDLT
jgi:hypothetical protein